VTHDQPAPPKADPELLAAGWQCRFLAAADRFEEATEIYRSLGLEVRGEPLAPADFGSACFGCAETACREYLMIYTRKPS
jgi:hypothetical protein